MPAAESGITTDQGDSIAFLKTVIQCRGFDVPGIFICKDVKN